MFLERIDVVMEGIDLQGAVITVVVLAIVLIVGAAAMGSISNGIEERHAARDTRADDVYGDDYEIVTSDDCYETCASTATTSEIQKRSILIMADRQVGWASAITLGQAVPGSDAEETADQLVEEGLLEKRQSDGLLGVPEYRYVGSEGRYENGLSDNELRQLVREQLYVTGTWMSEDEIVSSVPAAKWRVRQTLADLQEDGVVKTGTESESTFLPFGGHTAYAHTSVDHPPAGSTSTFDLFIVALIVAGVAILIGFVQRWRNGPKESSVGDRSAEDEQSPATE